jgi:hypothetical protein
MEGRPVADYCSIAEVESLIPTIAPLSGTTVPNSTQAATLLASVTGEIEMHMRGQGYETPATDTEALDSLKTIAMNGSAAKILKAAFPSAEAMGGDEGAYKTFREDYLAGLKFIDDGGLGSDSTSDDGTAVTHGFRDSQGTALSVSELVTRIDRETMF